MKALSKRNEEPQKASRPFDRDRDGFIIGEGGGILLLESLDHALARNAKIYAEILEVESSSDGNHLSNPSIEGQSRLMRKILKRANMQPEQVNYINAHATSTPLGDEFEIIVDKQGDIDRIKLKVELLPEVTKLSIENTLKDQLRLKTNLGYQIEYYDYGSLPRYEVKAKRFKDLRKKNIIEKGGRP